MHLAPTTARLGSRTRCDFSEDSAQLLAGPMYMIVRCEMHACSAALIRCAGASIQRAKTMACAVTILLCAICSWLGCDAQQLTD